MVDPRAMSSSASRPMTGGAPVASAPGRRQRRGQSRSTPGRAPPRPPPQPRPGAAAMGRPPRSTTCPGAGRGAAEPARAASCRPGSRSLPLTCGRLGPGRGPGRLRSRRGAGGRSAGAGRYGSTNSPGAQSKMSHRAASVASVSRCGTHHQPVDLLPGQRDAPVGQQRHQVGGGEHALFGHPPPQMPVVAHRTVAGPCRPHRPTPGSAPTATSGSSRPPHGGVRRCRRRPRMPDLGLHEQRVDPVLDQMRHVGMPQAVHRQLRRQPGRGPPHPRTDHPPDRADIRSPARSATAPAAGTPYRGRTSLRYCCQRLRGPRQHGGHRPPPRRAAPHRLAVPNLTDPEPAQLRCRRIRREIANVEHHRLPPAQPPPVDRLEQRGVPKRRQPPLPPEPGQPTPPGRRRRRRTPAAPRGSTAAGPGGPPRPRAPRCCPRGRPAPGAPRPAARTRPPSRTGGRTRTPGTTPTPPGRTAPSNAPTRPRR